jgi:hypothetical protein
MDWAPVADAVVVGAGHNGLVAANLLSDAGWEVLVLEATGQPGGSVRTAELTAPGFHATCSAPSSHSELPHRSWVGWSWSATAWSGCTLPSWSPTPTPTVAARCCHATWPRRRRRWRRSPPETVPPGSGCSSAGGASAVQCCRACSRCSRRCEPPSGWPPACRPATCCAWPGSPCCRCVGWPRRNSGSGGGLLLGGSALHADVGPEAPGSGFLGFLLCSLGQEFGYPAVRGGAGELTAALVQRLQSRGGQLVCDAPVEALEVRGGRAVAVRTADGQVVPVGRAVIGAVDAITLYRRLIGEDHLPPAVVADLERFQFDNATVKVDWALHGALPWEAEPARQAGTVHLADSLDELTMYSAQLACGVIPAKPLIVVGQMTTTDPTRSQAGTETLWA